MRPMVKALEIGGTIENRYPRIRERMYTKFRDARNVGYAIHYWHLKTCAKETTMLTGIPKCIEIIFVLMEKC